MVQALSIKNIDVDFSLCCDFQDHYYTRPIGVTPGVIVCGPANASGHLSQLSGNVIAFYVTCYYRK